MEFPDNPFWDFSLSTYGASGVAPACLALQERGGIDVNILLFCAWAGSQGVRLSPADVEMLSRAVDDWHTQAVRPLRAVRQRLKTGLDGQPSTEIQQSLRARIQKIEIDAEHIEQLRLFNALDLTDRKQGNPAHSTCAENMKIYLKQKVMPPGDVVDKAIETIANAALAPER